VVLPTALWGEKTGTFTNADRTVHLSEQAVDPPGEARSDLDIFLDFARRMGFKDRDGRPLIGWDDPASAFEAWKACSRGRPCDYSGLSHDRLRDAGGIQWPCTEAAPGGTERLYADGRFPTDPSECEDYGHDLATGAEQRPEEYRARQPGGRAFLRAADYQPGPEEPDDDYPLLLTTGRSLYQFHTRTKTGRAPRLQAAAPRPGWSCRRPTRPGWAWPTGTGSGWSRAGVPSRSRPGSPASPRGWCSSPSTTPPRRPTS
jgi:anaerobic selenocysteine-containing dehydrogenase